MKKIKRNIGQEILGAIRDIKSGKGKRFVAHAPSHVRDVREKLDLSQSQFATILGVSVRTLQAWEQGRRHPSGAALSLLRIASAKPKIVLDVLNPV